MLGLGINCTQRMRVCRFQGRTFRGRRMMLQGLRSGTYQILQVGRLGCLVDLLVVGLEAVGSVSWIDAALCSPRTSLPHLLTCT